MMRAARTAALVAALGLVSGTSLTGCGHPAPPPAAPEEVHLQPVDEGTPSPQGCQLPPGVGPGDFCGFENALFLDSVEKAIDMTIEAHPEIFDLHDGGPCGNCYQVLNVPAYERQVVKNLERQGLCAVAGEEFGVKNTNDFNEQYDLLTSSLHVRRQGGSYRGTCRPAAF
jgi:hypothetical protein